VQYGRSSRAASTGQGWWCAVLEVTRDAWNVSRKGRRAEVDVRGIMGVVEFVVRTLCVGC